MRKHFDRIRPYLEKLPDAEFLTAERLVRYPAVFLVVYLVAGIVMFATSSQGIDMFDRPLGTDFAKVYAAGHLVDDDDPMGAYNVSRHYLAQQRTVGAGDGHYVWHYPPPYLAVAWVLAKFEYITAMLLFVGSTFLLYLWAMWSLLKRRETVLIAAAFPGALVCAGHGQNGFLITAIFAFVVLHMHKWPMAAGIGLGLATLKPHLGLMFPVALATGKRWEVFMGAGLIAFLTAGLSALAWGTDVWGAFFEHLEWSRKWVLEDGAVGWPKIQSVYAAFGRVGAPPTIAWIIQGVASLAATGYVIAMWRRGEAPIEIKISAVICATFLALPYFLDYDLVLLALPIVLMTRLFLDDGFEAYDKSILLGLWLLPFVARLLGYAFIPITPVAMIGCCYWLWKRADIYEGESLNEGSRSSVPSY